MADDAAPDLLDVALDALTDALGQVSQALRAPRFRRAPAVAAVRTDEHSSDWVIGYLRIWSEHVRGWRAPVDGYPQHASGFGDWGGYYGQTVEEWGQGRDAKAAALVDVCVDELPPLHRWVVEQHYLPGRLPAVMRMRQSRDEVLAEAHELLAPVMRRKGLQ